MSGFFSTIFSTIGFLSLDSELEFDGFSCCYYLGAMSTNKFSLVAALSLNCLGKVSLSLRASISLIDSPYCFLASAVLKMGSFSIGAAVKFLPIFDSAELFSFLGSREIVSLLEEERSCLEACVCFGVKSIHRFSSFLALSLYYLGTVIFYFFASASVIGSLPCDFLNEAALAIGSFTLGVVSSYSFTTLLIFDSVSLGFFNPV